MGALELSRSIVQEVMAQAKRPALLCSFGKESMLLLTLMREIREDFPCLWFRTNQTPEQTAFAKSIIRELNLQVFSYAPAEVYVVPNEDGVTLIHEYSFGRNRFPRLVDIEPGERCSLKLDPSRTPQMSHVWDFLFAGWKDSDSHRVLGDDPFPDDGYFLGDAQVYAPLRHMSDADVWSVIEELHVPVDRQRYSFSDETRDDGVLKLCTACYSSGESEVFCPDERRLIPVQPWDRQASLNGFRQFYGLKEVA